MWCVENSVGVSSGDSSLVSFINSKLGADIIAVRSLADDGLLDDVARDLVGDRDDVLPSQRDGPLRRFDFAKFVEMILNPSLTESRRHILVLLSLHLYRTSSGADLTRDYAVAFKLETEAKFVAFLAHFQNGDVARAFRYFQPTPKMFSLFSAQLLETVSARLLEDDPLRLAMMAQRLPLLKPDILTGRTVEFIEMAFIQCEQDPQKAPGLSSCLQWLFNHHPTDGDLLRFFRLCHEADVLRRAYECVTAAVQPLLRYYLACSDDWRTHELLIMLSLKASFPRLDVACALARHFDCLDIPDTTEWRNCVAKRRHIIEFELSRKIPWLQGEIERKQRDLTFDEAVGYTPGQNMDLMQSVFPDSASREERPRISSMQQPLLQVHLELTPIQLPANRLLSTPRSILSGSKKRRHAPDEDGSGEMRVVAAKNRRVKWDEKLPSDDIVSQDILDESVESDGTVSIEEMPELEQSSEEEDETEVFATPPSQSLDCTFDFETAVGAPGVAERVANCHTPLQLEETPITQAASNEETPINQPARTPIAFPIAVSTPSTSADAPLEDQSPSRDSEYYYPPYISPELRHSLARKPIHPLDEDKMRVYHFVGPAAIRLQSRSVTPTEKVSIPDIIAAPQQAASDDGVVQIDSDDDDIEIIDDAMSSQMSADSEPDIIASSQRQQSSGERPLSCIRLLESETPEAASSGDILVLSSQTAVPESCISTVAAIASSQPSETIVIDSLPSTQFASDTANPVQDLTPAAMLSPPPHPGRRFGILSPPTNVTSPPLAKKVDFPGVADDTDGSFSAMLMSRVEEQAAETAAAQAEAEAAIAEAEAEAAMAEAGAAAAEDIHSPEASDDSEECLMVTSGESTPAESEDEAVHNLSSSTSEIIELRESDLSTSGSGDHDDGEVIDIHAVPEPWEVADDSESDGAVDGIYHIDPAFMRESDGDVDHDLMFEAHGEHEMFPDIGVTAAEPLTIETSSDEDEDVIAGSDNVQPHSRSSTHSDVLAESSSRLTSQEDAAGIVEYEVIEESPQKFLPQRVLRSHAEDSTSNYADMPGIAGLADMPRVASQENAYIVEEEEEDADQEEDVDGRQVLASQEDIVSEPSIAQDIFPISRSLRFRGQSMENQPDIVTGNSTAASSEEISPADIPQPVESGLRELRSHGAASSVAEGSETSLDIPPQIISDSSRSTHLPVETPLVAASVQSDVMSRLRSHDYTIAAEELELVEPVPSSPEHSPLIAEEPRKTRAASKRLDDDDASGISQTPNVPDLLPEEPRKTRAASIHEDEVPQLTTNEELLLADSSDVTRKHEELLVEAEDVPLANPSVGTSKPRRRPKKTQATDDDQSVSSQVSAVTEVKPRRRRAATNESDNESVASTRLLDDEKSVSSQVAEVKPRRRRAATKESDNESIASARPLDDEESIPSQVSDATEVKPRRRRAATKESDNESVASARPLDDEESVSSQVSAAGHGKPKRRRVVKEGVSEAAVSRHAEDDGSISSHAENAEVKPRRTPAGKKIGDNEPAKRSEDEESISSQISELVEGRRVKKRAGGTESVSSQVSEVLPDSTRGKKPRRTRAARILDVIPGDKFRLLEKLLDEADIPGAGASVEVKPRRTRAARAEPATDSLSSQVSELTSEAVSPSASQKSVERPAARRRTTIRPDPVEPRAISSSPESRVRRRVTKVVRQSQRTPSPYQASNDSVTSPDDEDLQLAKKSTSAALRRLRAYTTSPQRAVSPTPSDVSTRSRTRSGHVLSALEPPSSPGVTDTSDFLLRRYVESQSQKEPGYALRTRQCSLSPEPTVRAPDNWSPISLQAASPARKRGRPKKMPPIKEDGEAAGPSTSKPRPGRPSKQPK